MTIMAIMVGEAAFNYAPATLMQAPLVRAVLPPQFAGLHNFTVGISSSTVPTLATALVLDDVTHINYY